MKDNSQDSAVIELTQQLCFPYAICVKTPQKNRENIKIREENWKVKAGHKEEYLVSQRSRLKVTLK